MNQSKIILKRLGIGLLLAIGATAQSPIEDRLTVRFDNPVMVGSQRLEAGEYTVRQLSSASNARVLEFASDNGTKLQATATAIPALRNNTAAETSVMLEPNGADMVVRKIWIGGKNYGYEFPAGTGAITEARNQRDAINVAAQYQAAAPQDTTNQSASASGSGQSTTTQTDQTATQQPASPQSSSSTSSSSTTSDTGTAQSTTTDQQSGTTAPSGTAAQSGTMNNDQNTADRSSGATGTGTQSNSDSTTMPATASNWSELVLLGFLLAGAGLALMKLSARTA